MSEVQRSAYIETVNDPAMLKHLDYYAGVAPIRVAANDLFAMPFKVIDFLEDTEYWAEVDRVRRRGYDNSRPIKVQKSPSGDWIVDEEDADRFVAAKKVSGELFTNLLTNKVRFVRFDLDNGSKQDRFYIWDAEPVGRTI